MVNNGKMNIVGLSGYIIGYGLKGYISWDFGMWLLVRVFMKEILVYFFSIKEFGYNNKVIV